MRIIILILILFFAISANAETILTGGVDYNVNSAREELLQTPRNNINPELVVQNLKDKYYNENINYALQGNVDLKDRVLAFFSDSTYAVMYNDDKYHVWYYSKDGNLIYTEGKDNLDYPYKSYKYTPSGKLVNMSLRASKEETFIYSPDGKLLAHWLKSNAYDEHGNIIMTRNYSY